LALPAELVFKYLKIEDNFLIPISYFLGAVEEIQVQAWKLFSLRVCRRKHLLATNIPPILCMTMLLLL